MMSLTDHKISLIDGAIRKDLTEPERMEFDALFQSDEDFRTRFELENEIAESVSDQRAEAFRASVQSTIQSKRKSLSWTGNLTKIAAVLLLALGSSLLFNHFSGSVNHVELAANYFQPYPMMSIERGAESEASKMTIYEDYSIGEYQRVVELFESVPTNEITDLDKIYLASSFISSGSPEKALESLSTIESSSLIYTISQWYAALANLQMGELEATRTILESLGKTNGKYGKKANELLQEL